MGYTVYWKNKKRLSSTKLIAVKKAVMKTFRLELKKDDLLKKWDDWNKAWTKGRCPYELDKYFHEGFTASMIGNRDFEFCKTARKPYDGAIKKALIKLQKLTNNAYDISCDDGGKYFADTVLEKTVWGNWVPKGLAGVEFVKLR